jgi:hypothetical protein
MGEVDSLVLGILFALFLFLVDFFLELGGHQGHFDNIHSSVVWLLVGL